MSGQKPGEKALQCQGSVRQRLECRKPEIRIRYIMEHLYV
jgi:hypothetical protein